MDRMLRMLVLVAALAGGASCQGRHTTPLASRRILPQIYQVTKVPYDSADFGECVAVSGSPGVLAQPSSEPVAAVLNWTGSRADQLNPPVKFEINYSDPPGRDHIDTNPGWHDCTALAPNWDTDPSDGIDFSRVSKHTYLGIDEGETHTVSIRGRITFADGTIVESLPADEPQVTLLPWENPLGVTKSRNVGSALYVKRDSSWTGFLLNGGEVEFSAPLEVGIQVDSSMAAWDGTPVKYEVNWGDGPDWQDVTADSAHWDYSAQDGIVDGEVSSHSYSVPGTYRVQCRATYWDDYVQVQHDDFRPTVVVDPPTV